MRSGALCASSHNSDGAVLQLKASGVTVFAPAMALPIFERFLLSLITKTGS
jgi:hypothetical protein